GICWTGQGACSWRKSCSVTVFYGRRADGRMGESMVSAPQSAADQTEAGMLPKKNEGAWRFHAVNSRAGWFLWQSKEENSNKLLVFIAMVGLRCAGWRIFPRCRHNSEHPQVRRRYSAEGGNPGVRTGASGSTHFPHVLAAGSLIHAQPELGQYGQQMVEDRSEERRVGKEWRSRWSPADEGKNASEGGGH